MPLCNPIDFILAKEHAFERSLRNYGGHGIFLNHISWPTVHASLPHCVPWHWWPRGCAEHQLIGGARSSALHCTSSLVGQGQVYCTAPAHWWDKVKCTALHQLIGGARSSALHQLIGGARSSAIVSAHYTCSLVGHGQVHELVRNAPAHWWSKVKYTYTDSGDTFCPVPVSYTCANYVYMYLYSPRMFGSSLMFYE